MTLALSSWWMVGWVVGAVVIALVAVLLLTITGLARKIDGTAGDLIKDLDSIATKTRPLQAVGRDGTTPCRRSPAACASPAARRRRQDRYSTSPGWRP